jgi:hypothetical protein
MMIASIEYFLTVAVISVAATIAILIWLSNDRDD